MERERRKPWITDVCLDLIEERRATKNRRLQLPEYKRLCKAVKQACKKAKRDWLKEKAEEAESACKRGDTKKVY